MSETMTKSNDPTYAEVLRQAWPAILANAAVPLLGIVDTAIISFVGGEVELGAVALSTLVFNAIYWALGFSRMSTTALVARAVGASDFTELWRVVARALTFAGALGLLLLVIRSPLTTISLAALNPSPAVAASASAYIHTRILAAPAVLVQMVVSGALIGMGRTRALLVIQLFTNVVNLVGNFVFVGAIGGHYRGVVGIAAGTLCAECSAACLALWVLSRTPGAWAPSVRAESHRWFWHRDAWRGVLGVNFNIFLRTLALLAGFAWFTRTGTQLGQATLAANHLLQQVVGFSAFFLDGVAFVAESHVGQAIGAQDRGLLHRAVTRTSVVAFGFGAALALSVWGLGPMTLSALAPSVAVLEIALAHLPFAAVYVLVGVVPWQLDGIFIGAACGVALRNAAVVSLVVFLVVAVWWTNVAGSTGLWWAMLVYIAMRGAMLLLHWRHVTRLFT